MLSDFDFFWLLTGAVCCVFTNWSWHLSFDRKPLSVGTIILWMAGTALWPLTLLGGVVFLMCWITYPDQKYVRIKWPLWWARCRFKQHRFLRRLWYLGTPPDREDIFSDWRDVPREWKE